MNKVQTIIYPFKYGQVKNQHGIVLIVSLTILMVMTLIGVSAMKTSSMQERMSGNSRDYQIAFEAAEIALRAGEDYIKSISAAADFSSTGGNNGKFTPRSIAASAAWQIETNWTTSNTNSVILANVSNNPEYIIEILDSNYGEIEDLELGGGPIGDITLFRITARGYGKNPNTKVMLQADFGKVL